MTALESFATSLTMEQQQVPDVVKQLFHSQRLRCDKYREEVAQLQEAQIHALQVLTVADRQPADGSSAPLQLLIETMRGTLQRQSERVVALEEDLRRCEDVILSAMMHRERSQQSNGEPCRMSTWVAAADPRNEVTPLESTQRPSDEHSIPAALSTEQLNQCNTSLTTPVRGHSVVGKGSLDSLGVQSSEPHASPSYFAESATTPAGPRTERDVRARNAADISAYAPLTPSPVATAGQHFAMEDSTTSSAIAPNKAMTVPQSKYDRLKVKYHRLRDSWCRTVEQLSEQRTAWGELWMQHSLSKGLVRCTIRMTPEGVVSSSPGRAPKKAVNGHHMAVVSCGRSGPRKAKVDAVIQSSVSSLDAVDSLVSLHIPLTQCGGNALFLCYGAAGTGRSSFAHDLCIQLVHALSTTSVEVACQQGVVVSNLRMSIDATVCDEDDVWMLQQRTVPLQRASDGGSPLSHESAAAIVSPLFHERRSRFLNCHLIVTMTIGESEGEKNKPEGRDSVRSDSVKKPSIFSRVTVVDMIPFFSVTNEVPQHRHGGAELLAMVSAARAWQLQQISSPAIRRTTCVKSEDRPAPPPADVPIVYESSIPLCNLLFRTLTEKYFVECHVVALVSPMGSPEESWDTVTLASKMRQCGIRKAVGADESYTLPDMTHQSMGQPESRRDDEQPYHPFDTSQILRVDSCDD